MAAVIKGCSTAVRQLLSLGANIKAIDADGRHCIHHLAKEDDFSVMKILMDVSLYVTKYLMNDLN